MALVLKKGTGPGTWRQEPLFDGPEWFAVITCTHGHDGTLWTHNVDADGVVHPSAVCSTPGCTFHEWVQLDGWDPVGRRRRS